MKKNNLPNWKLIDELLQARNLANEWTKTASALRDIALPRLKERKGRLIARTGTALLKIEQRRTFSLEVMDKLVALGRLDPEVLALCISTAPVEKVIVNGLPDLNWDSE